MSAVVERLRSLVRSKEYRKRNSAMAVLYGALNQPEAALVGVTEERLTEKLAREQLQAVRAERHRRIRALPLPCLFELRPFRGDVPFVLLKCLDEPRSVYWRLSPYLTGCVNSPLLLEQHWISQRLCIEVAQTA
jgi:hypothetical protein